MEGIIRDTITVHMKENKLLSKYVFGFINGRSTVLQLLKVLDIWAETLNNGGCIDVIYCHAHFGKIPPTGSRILKPYVYIIQINSQTFLRTKCLRSIGQSLNYVFTPIFQGI